MRNFWFHLQTDFSPNGYRNLVFAIMCAAASEEDDVVNVSRWGRFFRIFQDKKSTFQYIRNELEGVLKPKPNPYTKRTSVSDQKQVAMCIYYLGCCAELRVISEIFGLAKSTVWKCVRRVCKAIIQILKPIWITIPNADECEEAARLFKQKIGLPQIIGALNGSRILITPPKEGYSDFINRKNLLFLNLQSPVDAWAL